MQRKDLILPTALTLLGIAILCALALWQLERLEWKQNLLAQISAEYAKDASKITLTPKSIDAKYDYKRGALRGHYNIKKQIRIAPRVHNETIGQHIYTPFILSDGSTILVNRGWTPKDWMENAPPAETIITGTLRRMWERTYFTPPNNPAKDEWYFPDAAEIAAAKNIKNIHTAIFFLETTDTEKEYPIPQGQKPDLPNNHLQYALFWFSMAAVLSVIYGLRFWRGNNT